MSRVSRSWPRIRTCGGSNVRSSRSGAVAGRGGGRGRARSRARLMPGDQKSARLWASGRSVTSISGRAASGGAAVSAQRAEQVLPAAAAPGQDAERVHVERLGQHVADRGQVLARHLPVRAGAGHLQVPAERGNSGVPQSANTSSISRGISPASSLARNSACPARACSTRRHCGVVSGVHLDPHPVRLGPRPLHLGGHVAARDLEAEHLAPAGVVPAPGQPRRSCRTTPARR